MITRKRACAARKRTSSLCRRRRATSCQRAVLRARHRACSTRAASSPLRWRGGGGAGGLAGAGCPHVNQDGSQLSGRRVAAAASAGGWPGGAAVSAKSCRLEPRASGGGGGGGGGGSSAAPGPIALVRADGWSASSGRAKSRPPPRPGSATGSGSAMRSLWPGGSIIEFLSARVRLAGIGARRLAGEDGCTSTAGLRPWRPPCRSQVGLTLAPPTGRFDLTSPVGLRLAAAMPASSCTLTPPPG